MWILNWESQWLDGFHQVYSVLETHNLVIFNARIFCNTKTQMKDESSIFIQQMKHEFSRETFMLLSYINSACMATLTKYRQCFMMLKKKIFFMFPSYSMLWVFLLSALTTTVHTLRLNIKDKRWKNTFFALWLESSRKCNDLAILLICACMNAKKLNDKNHL